MCKRYYTHVMGVTDEERLITLFFFTGPVAQLDRATAF